MEAPLPAQPDSSASGVPRIRRQAARKPKQRRRTPSKHFSRALRWARTVPIPTRYPNGKKVYDPPGLRATLVELAMWCSDEWVEKYGYEPQPPLHPVEGSDYPGLLATLGININVHRLRMSALRRLGLVTKTYQGNGNRTDRWGNQRRTRWTRYRLNIEPAVTTFQPELLSEENRTGRHSPMSEKHGLTDSPMSEGHGSTDSPMSGRHGLTDSPMSERHGLTPRPLLDMTSERDDTSESDAAAAVNSESEESVSSVPNPVLIQLVESIVSALNDQLRISPPLEVRDVLQLMPDLSGQPLRLPSDLESHVVNEISRVQPDRIEAYVASIIGGAITRGYTKRTFTPKPQQWGSGRRPKLY